MCNLQIALLQQKWCEQCCTHQFSNSLYNKIMAPLSSAIKVVDVPLIPPTSKRSPPLVEWST